MDDPKQSSAPPPQTIELSDEEYQQAYEASLKGNEDGKEQKKKPEQESPVKSWWDKFNGFMSKTRHADAGEVVRGAARGVVNAGINAGQTVVETAMNVALPGSDAKGMGKKYAGVENKMEDALLGKRPDDALAAFTESTTQAIAGFAATNAVLPGSGLVKGLVKGAIVDATMFDPYEAQLAELAARTKVPGLSHLGKLLSVEDDDSAEVSRLKRAAAGAIPGSILDGLVAMARGVRASKVLKGGATGTAKTAAEETVAESQKVLSEVAEGTHVPEGSHVKIVDQEDGTVAVLPREAEEEWSPLVFGDRAEALQQASSMDAAIQDGLDAGKVDLDEEAIHAAVANGDEVELKAPVANTVEQDLELVKALSESIIAKRSALEATTGGSITIEEGKQLAKETLSQIPEDKLHETIKGLLKANPESQDIVSVAAKMVLGQKGRNIVKLHDIIDARPHDPVVMEQLKKAIAGYFDLRHAIGPGESAAGRRLRFVQEGETMAKESFETAEQSAARKEVADTLEEIERNINKTDTNAVSAADFSFARARAKLEAAYAKIQKGSINFEHDPEAAVDRAGKIKGAADDFRGTPDELKTLSPEEQAALKATKTSTTNPIEELSRWMDSAESGVDRDMAKGQSLLKRAKDEFSKGDPVGDFKKAAEKDASTFTKMDGPKTAGMKMRAATQMDLNDLNAKLIARMFKLAGGAPRDVDDAVLRASAVLQKGGAGHKVLEVFTNFLLSGPPTWATVVTSGQVLSIMEPVTKIMAGTMGLNRSMIREGADTLFGLYAHLGDNIRIAAMAMREGRSIINPAPSTYAIGGLTGKVIRTPGNIMMGLDEFTRVSNYRAHVRAMSLRMGREQGLSGAALAKRVDEDLRMAFDPDTGIATIPQSLKYADVATLSAPLQSGFGRELQTFTNNALAAKFVVPFVRASANIFNYVWQSAPGLNLFNKQAREIILKGGEEAAALHARSLLATTVGMYGFLQAKQGNLTGKGPSDPELRKAWLKDNQPYSIRVGDKWVSYQRGDPLAFPLGLIADLHVFSEELGDDHMDVEEFMYASIGALVSNLGSKTYLRGIMDFSEAWHQGDPAKVGRYLQRQVSALAVPTLLDKFNPDDTYREVQSIGDAIKAKLPYFSTTLDARYDMFGEKVMKAPGLLNRAVNPFQVREVKSSKVEEELLAIGKSLAPAAEKIEGGLIDLHDKQYVEREGQPSPYVRMMELIKEPGHGRPSLRKAMEELINRPNWDEKSDGTAEFRGGQKLARLAGKKEEYEARAFRQVLKEYPKLKDHVEAVRRGRGAAMRGGEEKAAQAALRFGPVNR